MMDLFKDDKFIICISLTAIAITAMISFGVEALPMVSNVVAGLLGVAVGKRFS